MWLRVTRGTCQKHRFLGSALRRMEPELPAVSLGSGSAGSPTLSVVVHSALLLWKNTRNSMSPFLLTIYSSTPLLPPLAIFPDHPCPPQSSLIPSFSDSLFTLYPHLLMTNLPCCCVIYWFSQLCPLLTWELCQQKLGSVHLCNLVPGIHPIGNGWSGNIY